MRYVIALFLIILGLGLLSYVTGFLVFAVTDDPNSGIGDLLFTVGAAVMVGCAAVAVLTALAGAVMDLITASPKGDK